MYPAIQIYAGINLFLTGYYYADEVRYAHDADEKLRAWLKVAILLLFGIAIMGIAYIGGLLIGIWWWLNRTFFVMAVYDVHFSTRYDDMETGELIKLNRLAHKQGKRTLSNRIFWFVVRKINKRNNFTFHPQEKSC